MEYIIDTDTDIDIRLWLRVCKHYKIKNLGEYHDFYVQSDTLLLTDVFENLKLDLLTSIDMVSMIAKCIRCGISCYPLICKS